MNLIRLSPSHVGGALRKNVSQSWLAKRLGLYFGLTLPLRPSVDRVALAQASVLAPSTETKCLQVDLQGGALPPGHYSIELPGSSAARRALLLYHSGDLIHRSRGAIVLRSAGSMRGFCDKLTLATGASELHVAIVGTTSDVPSMRIRRFSRAEFYLRLFVRAAVAQNRDDAQPGLSIARASRVLALVRLKELAAELRRVGGTEGDAISSYERWMVANEQMDPDFIVLRRRMDKLARRPLISVLMPACDAPAEIFFEAVGSVRAQIYEHWELCILDDASAPVGLREKLMNLANKDSRIRLVPATCTQDSAGTLNAAFAASGGEWVTVLGPADRLARDALAEVALRAATDPECDLVYSDEDELDMGGRRRSPCFKPEFSRELLRSQDYFGNLTAYRACKLRDIGGWSRSFACAERYDLNLRMFEKVGATGIRHVGRVLYHRRMAADGAFLDADAEKGGLMALENHIRRSHLNATVKTIPAIGGYRVRHALPNPAPIVSLVIPTRDRADLLRQCVESICVKTTYPNYEILVMDNGSRAPETLAYLDELRHRECIRVLSHEGPFNFSAINNQGVRNANGAIVGLINNDIEVITPDWLEELVSWAIQPDIGCVGAKLYYSDERVQHAGVMLGVGHVAGHAHRYFPRDHAGYFGRLKLAQNMSAVTGACLVVRKEIYERAGGLNEIDLPVAYNDVDFCLKVRELGYLNVWTPFAELYHREGVSRLPERDSESLRRYRAEVAYMRQRWSLLDPYYSENLAVDREDFSPRPDMAESRFAGDS